MKARLELVGNDAKEACFSKCLGLDMWDKYLDRDLEITEDTSLGEKPVTGFMVTGPQTLVQTLVLNDLTHDCMK